MAIKGPSKQKKFKLPKLEVVEKYPPNAPLDRRYMRDGKAYWVKGYKVFDPEKIVSTYKGAQPLKADKSSSWVLTVAEGDEKPLRVRCADIRLHQVETKLTFNEVFGSGGSGSVSLGVVEAAEKEDLTIGLAPIPVD